MELPSFRDARLHASVVVLTLHVLGQVAFGFRVSVVQIAAAIGASAALELAITFVRQRRIVWPASAILTGSGVGLILRISEPGTVERIGHWSSTRWYVFAGVSVASLLSKYLLRLGGRQVFNPSNLGLLVAFLVLGSDRVEPLDLWWAPFGPALVVAYAVVIGGGLLITGRLGLWPMAAGFWVTLALGGGVLAGSGHCITTNWSARPVCDGGFWWLLVSSPEIAVFLFFMITDPKTAPTGAAQRAMFGAGVALVGLFLMAPYRTEFATKVSLFAALAIMCVVRVGALRMPARWRSRATGGSQSVVVGASLPLVVGVVMVGLVFAGRPARHAFDGVETAVAIDRPAIVAGLDLDPDPNLLPLPTITMDPSVARFDDSLSGRGAETVARALLVDLAVEAHALRHNDADLLAAVDHGARLAVMRQAVEDHGDTGQRVVTEHQLTSLRLHVVRRGGQAGSLLAVDTDGSVVLHRFEADGTSSTSSRQPAAFRFVLRPAGDAGGWLIVDGESR